MVLRKTDCADIFFLRKTTQQHHIYRFNNNWRGNKEAAQTFKSNMEKDFHFKMKMFQIFKVFRTKKHIYNISIMYI